MDTKDKIIMWMLSGDTGISSMAIVSQMTGFKTYRCGSDYPRDRGDFGRCHLLLQAVPEFIPRIEEMAQRSPQWAVLVEHWHELTQIYLSGSEGMYERMSQILEKAPNKNTIDLGGGLSFEIPSK